LAKFKQRGSTTKKEEEEEEEEEEEKDKLALIQSTYRRALLLSCLFINTI
jgi:hypothetical protein